MHMSCCVFLLVLVGINRRGGGEGWVCNLQQNRTGGTALLQCAVWGGSKSRSTMNEAVKTESADVDELDLAHW
jgi:hypothetical protein